jgi:hypothetical protein
VAAVTYDPADQREQRARQAGQGTHGQQRAGGVAATELVGMQERGHGPVDLRLAAISRVEHPAVKGTEGLALDADHDGAAGPDQQVTDGGDPLLDGVLLGQAVLGAEPAGRADADPGRVGRVAGLELPAR